DLPCGTPPQPVRGAIQFTDITQQVGYQQLAAPSTDIYSDFSGGQVNGNGQDCYDYYGYEQNGNGEFFGPFTRAYDLATVSLPFPFGFSGIYSDGGSFVQPFQVNVWSTGLLPFDPSVSFDPRQYPLNTVPSDCIPEESDING